MSAMSRAATLSVCIPCFNEERFIGETIESVLLQDHQDFRLLVVDDCSTDQTLDVVKRFSDPRIIVHRNRENLGLYENQNRCLQLAKTEYVKILCADDLLEQGCLAEQVAVLDREPTVVLVFGASKVVDAQGKVLLRRRFSPAGKIAGKALVKAILVSGRNPIGEPSGVMFRRRLVEQHRLRLNAREFRHMADLEFWIQLLEHGDGYYLDRELFSFRLHRSAGTATLLARSIAEHRKIVDRYADRYPLRVVDRALFNVKLLLYFIGKMAFVRMFAR